MRIRSSWAGLVMALLLFSCCGDDSPEEGAVTTLSYRGHEQDVDINCFIEAYPDAAGTRLDDCVLCHTEGEVPGRRGDVRIVNACDYCHWLGTQGESLSASLNPYGNAYLAGGRDLSALRRIEPEDSDGDGHANLTEIRGGFFPGRAASNPAKPAAPFVELTRADLESLPIHQQFMLLNSHKQRCDSYATYRGVTFADLLTAHGVDPQTITGITGITVFAPDGFAKSYSREEVVREYPAGVFHAGLDDARLGEGKGIVTYPGLMPDLDLPDGAAIPGRQFLLLAFLRDFEPIARSTLDPADQRIRGEGPFRSVRPQTTASPPDRGSRYPLGDEYDYDDTLDHNAGDSVRGVTVIRVDPMPGEYEEFDARNASWRFLERGKPVIYGHGIR